MDVKICYTYNVAPNPKRSTKPRVGTGKRAVASSPMLHPVYRRWMLDADYLAKLSPADQEWYAQFSDEHYAADFRYEEPLTTTQADKRAAYGRQNANGRDLSSWAAAGQKLDPMPADDTGVGYDATPTPVYLSEGDYRAALLKYRELVDKVERTPRQEQQLELLQSYMQSIARSETVPGDRYLELDEQE